MRLAYDLQVAAGRKVLVCLGLLNHYTLFCRQKLPLTDTVFVHFCHQIKN